MSLHWFYFLIYDWCFWVINCFIFLSVLNIFMITSVTIQGSSLVGCGQRCITGFTDREASFTGWALAMLLGSTWFKYWPEDCLSWLGLLVCFADSSKWIPGYNFKISNSWFTFHCHPVGTSNLSPFDATAQSDMASQSLQSTGSNMIVSFAVIVKLLSLLSPVTFHSNRHQWMK